MDTIDRSGGRNEHTRTATFFITTARSGTQWVCETLRELYPDLLSVEHEPIRYAYAPRRCLRNPAALASLRADPRVRRHFDRIHETLRGKSYVEVGFPAFAAAPLLRDEFGDRLQLVQLVRHPVQVAASIVTHRWYSSGVRRDIKVDVALTPNDAGVRLRNYAGRWAAMSEFEKALFYWAEVHLYGLEVQTRFSAVPFLQVSFEDLLGQRDARVAFTRFLDVPYRSGFDSAPSEQRDRFKRRTPAKIEPGQMREMPEAVDLARRFGYEVGAVATQEFQTRYQRSWLESAKRQVVTALRRCFVGVVPVGALTYETPFQALL